MSSTQESVRRVLRKPLERVACRVYLSSDQENLVDGAWTKVLLDTKTYDLGGNFDEVTNHRFVIPVAGLYSLRGKVDFINTVNNKGYDMAIYVNGSEAFHKHIQTGQADEIDDFVLDEFYLNKDDYVELYAQSNAGVDTVDIVSGSGHTFLGVRLISKEGIKQ